MSDAPRKQASACYFEDDLCSNPQVTNPIGELISRRLALKSAAALAATALGLGARAEASAAASSSSSTLLFPEVAHGISDREEVAEGYDVKVLMRWGDPLYPSAPAFDPGHQEPSGQLQQFGYNCDYIAFLPIRENGRIRRGLICVNHEYVNTNLMFPGVELQDELNEMTAEMVATEMAALGLSVVEVERRDDGWAMTPDSRYNRRLSALATEMILTGPVAGHPRVQTSADPTGTRVLGTLNNCAGGVTPWGTMLTCEENFNGFFSGDASKTDEERNHKRYGIDGPSHFSPAWARHFERFDIEKEPHEPNRFGWVVEFDPFDPKSVPKKRTALGRVKHEGAGLVINRDGRIVIYCGDDERFDYVYRFVSERAYDPKRREANRDLLDSGTLSVAKFDEGRVRWLPLVYGKGPLTPENDFHCQADVLLETRRAADLLGATPMDRPEDVEASPRTGHVYVVLTNNSKRTGEQVDPGNPRSENNHGHILELIPPSRGNSVDHAADEFTWEVFLKAGNPAVPEDGAQYHPDLTENGWFSSPDNIAFDTEGRLWLTTDSDHQLTGFGDGVYACDTQGPGRSLTRLFFRGPRGSEVSGVCLTPDDETMFVSVQHPGEEEGSCFEKPTTRWPDFDPALPPRPAVVAITRSGGGKLGG